MAFLSRQYIAIFCAGFCALTAGCDHAPAQSTDKPVIAVSIFPVASLVEQLTSGWAEVVTLLPPGTSPHGAGLTANQVREISRARMLIVVGMGMDEWAEKGAAAAGSSAPPVVRYADLIAEPSVAATRPANNHLWLDPVLAKQFVAALSVRLQEQFPAHSKAIRASTLTLTADLTRLDQEYHDQLAGVPQKELITFHNAFDLIAARYQLKILVRLTDIEMAPGGEVTPDKYREAIDAVSKYGVHTLYGEPEFPDQAVQALHRQTGADVLVLDPEGNPAVDGYRTYQEMMRTNLRTLVEGQSRTPPSANSSTSAARSGDRPQPERR